MTVFPEKYLEGALSAHACPTRQDLIERPGYRLSIEENFARLRYSIWVTILHAYLDSSKKGVSKHRILHNEKGNPTLPVCLRTRSVARDKGV
jgi:hypothetical protein